MWTCQNTNQYTRRPMSSPIPSTQRAFWTVPSLNRPRSVQISGQCVTLSHSCICRARNRTKMTIIISKAKSLSKLVQTMAVEVSALITMLTRHNNRCAAVISPAGLFCVRVIRVKLDRKSRKETRENLANFQNKSNFQK